LSVVYGVVDKNEETEYEESESVFSGYESVAVGRDSSTACACSRLVGVEKTLPLALEPTATETGVVRGERMVSWSVVEQPVDRHCVLVLVLFLFLFHENAGPSPPFVVVSTANPVRWSILFPRIACCRWWLVPSVVRSIAIEHAFCWTTTCPFVQPSMMTMP